MLKIILTTAIPDSTDADGITMAASIVALQVYAFTKGAT